MSNPYLGEIRMFAGNFAPEGWALCDGALLSIAGHEALFSLIGLTYGGDGTTTFALPDLRGRLPVGQGAGPGLTPRRTGEQFGTDTVTLTPQQLPAHSHEFVATTAIGTGASPENTLFAETGDDEIYAPAPENPPVKTMNQQTVRNDGGGTAHDNHMPSLAMIYIICLAGIVPPKS